jgi:hypothetical protein
LRHLSSMHSHENDPMQHVRNVPAVLLLALITLLLPTTVFGLNENEAIQKALLNNTGIRTQIVDRASDSLRLRGVDALWLPAVSLTGNATYAPRYFLPREVSGQPSRCPAAEAPLPV